MRHLAQLLGMTAALGVAPVRRSTAEDFAVRHAPSPAEQDRIVQAAQAKRERKNAQRLARVGA